MGYETGESNRQLPNLEDTTTQDHNSGEITLTHAKRTIDGGRRWPKQRKLQKPSESSIVTPETKENGEYTIKKGTTIWPEKGAHGLTQQDISANRLPQQVRGLTGYESTGGFETYRDGHFDHHPTGTRFGTHSKGVHRNKVK